MKYTNSDVFVSLISLGAIFEGFLKFDRFFVVIIRSGNIFVFDWLTITKETHLEVDS